MREKRIWVYDTTLRDGAQREGIALSLTDKLKIVRKLDEMGIPFIEGDGRVLILRMWSCSGSCASFLPIRQKWWLSVPLVVRGANANGILCCRLFWRLPPSGLLSLASPGISMLLRDYKPV